MRTSMILTAILAVTACTDDPDPTSIPKRDVTDVICRNGDCPGDVKDILDQPGTAITIHQNAYLIDDGLLQAQNAYDACDLLPTTGACAVACDPEALARHIPSGACMSFRCDLSNGGVMLAGGCN